MSSGSADDDGEALPPPRLNNLLLAAPDDDRGRLLGDVLETLGTVRTAMGLEAAMAAAREWSPSLVVAVGDGEGLEMVRRLRALPETRLAAIVLVGDDVSGHERLESLAAGADDWVPFAVGRDGIRVVVTARWERTQAWHQALAAAEDARERAEAAGRARDEFLAVASHELRTPLGALLIWTQLLRSERMDEEALARALGMIERSARTLAQLIDDLVDVSRLVSGRLRLELRPLDVGTVVDAALRALQAADEAKAVSIETVVDPSIRSVSGDATRLQQVVSQIVSAAVKASPQGGRVVVRVEHADGYVRLTVSDAAASQGRSAEAQRKLGFRVTLARKLIELHGGSFDMGSGDGAGGLFAVTLPGLSAVSLPPGAGDLSSPISGRQDPDALRGVRILLVDDEDDARDALSIVLERSGAHVRAVASAGAALTAIKGEVPDVLLSDISMPHEDGYSLIRKVRALPAESGGEIPAAAVTAYASDRDRERALGEGYLAHLAKPVEPRALIELVAHLLRGSRRRAPLVGDAAAPAAPVVERVSGPGERQS